MALGPGDWSRMREIFEAALALPREARPRYLATTCSGDEALRQQVQLLLDSHERATGFLENPAALAPIVAPRTTHLEGQRIGPYQVSARIGAGGMGDVYKARDTRLDRTVAIKVLSAHIASDPPSRERFEREARAIAALNHPHICTLYDVGHHNPAAHSTGSGKAGTEPGFDYLVMEYVEGETLAARLASGPLPVTQALQYARQIAAALDKAHRAGIVHRDLKPGNVMLTKAGAKLLDFGLAKSAATATGQSALTAPGLILGTIQYMAPEQIEGKPCDPRTDIFAFGAVLDEMLTGNKVFPGTDQGAIAAAILAHDPARLPPLPVSAPPALDRVVRKCLAKDPDERWQSAGDLASEIEWIAHDGAAVEGVRTSEPVRGRTRERVAWGVAALLAAAAVTAVLVRSPSSRPALTPKRFVVPLPDIESRLGSGSGRTIALLPDGSGLTYLGKHGQDWRLHLHTLADGVSRPIAGTERAGVPFISPDGKWLGFVQGGRLMKVAVGGGSPVAICDVPGARGVSGVSWGSDDRIVFGASDGLWRVPASGGTPEALSTLATGEASHTTPEVLPGGQAVVFTILSKSGAMEDATIAVVSRATGARRTLVNGGASARYSPTGHLVYVRGSDLVAVPFDPDRLSVAGTPFLAIPAIRVTPLVLLGHFDLSTDGTMAYLPGGGAELQRTLVWVDRKGTVTPIPMPPRPYFHPSLLPDERSVIVELEETPHNIWHGDLMSGALTRLTHEGANHRAVLSPDGRFMGFGSDRAGPRSLFRQATDGSGAAERLLEATSPQNATSWSRDGRWLAFNQTDPKTKEDIWVLPFEGDRKPRPFVQTASSEHSAVFSPDGRWIAYSSDESGQREVLMRAFPGPGPRKQVSTNGGDMPVFSHDGGRLFYRLADRVLVAEFVTEPALSVRAPQVVFELPPSQISSGSPNFAVNRKGDAVLAVKQPAGDLHPSNVHIIVNWFEVLRQAGAAK